MMSMEKRENTMCDIQSLSEQFKFMFEQFINGCDSIEEIEKWDKEEYGEMEVFYTGDLMSVVTYLTAVDGNFSVEESDNINQLLGLDYSADELQEIYNECESNISEIAQSGVAEGVELLKSINIKLAEHYKELLVLACKIIANSDCFTTTEENAVIDSITAIEV